MDYHRENKAGRRYYQGEREEKKEDAKKIARAREKIGMAAIK